MSNGGALSIPSRVLGVQGLVDGGRLRGFDGLCLTLLVTAKSGFRPAVSRDDRYAWLPLSSQPAVHYLEGADERGPRFFLL